MLARSGTDTDKVHIGDRVRFFEYRNGVAYFRKS